MRVAVVAGEGVVARFPGAVLVALPGTPDAVIDGLVRACVALPPGEDSGRGLSRQVAGLVLGVDPMPSFCAMAPVSGGMSLLVGGDAVVTVFQGGLETRIAGRDASSFVDRILTGPIEHLVIGAIGAGPPSPLLDLREGVVPGAGALVSSPVTVTTPSTPPSAQIGIAAAAPSDVAAPMAPPTVAPAAPAPEAAPTSAFPAPAVQVPESAGAPAPEAPSAGPDVEPPVFEAIPLRGGPPPAPHSPLPVAGRPEPAGTTPPEGYEPAPVKGIVCSRGHFGHPLSLYCSSCGISTVQQTRNLVSGKRPPLGIVVFDDGSTFGIDSDYVVGADPSQDEAVVSGRARPLPIEDVERTISLVHAEIHLEGWDVKVTDRNSYYGTYLFWQGAPGWVRIPPNTPTDIRAGTYVLIGRRSFVFDSHHQRRPYTQ